MQLENMMEMYQPRVSETRQQTYFVVGDLEGLSASALYGDMDRGYDFKESGFQLHIHEDSVNGLTKAKIKPYNSKGISDEYGLTNTEAFTAEKLAINIGMPKINIGS